MWIATSTEKKETAVGFFERARTYFTSAGIKHKRARPYRPQTNGKVERFNRTLVEEWAYARPHTSESEKREAFPGVARVQSL